MNCLLKFYAGSNGKYQGFKMASPDISPVSPHILFIGVRGRDQAALDYQKVAVTDGGQALLCLAALKDYFMPFFMFIRLSVLLQGFGGDQRKGHPGRFFKLPELRNAADPAQKHNFVYT